MDQQRPPSRRRERQTHDVHRPSCGWLIVLGSRARPNLKRVHGYGCRLVPRLRGRPQRSPAGMAGASPGDPQVVDVLVVATTKSGRDGGGRACWDRVMEPRWELRIRGGNEQIRCLTGFLGLQPERAPVGGISLVGQLS
jgi:hypothetical protein